jgi:Putative zinc-finger
LKILGMPMKTGHCKKYGDWMTDAALGGLAPRHERELLAHAAACDTCREAYRHAREVAAFVDRGVESLVSGEPSPHFPARLRRRIADEPMPAPFTWLSWRPVAAIAVAMAIFTVLATREWPGARPHTTPINFPSPAIPNTRLTTNQPPPHRPPAARAGWHAGHAEPRVLASVSTRRGFSPYLGPSPQPEVLVPPGQLVAVMELAKAIESRHIDGKELLAAEQRADAPLEIKPLEIAPLGPTEQGSPSEATENPSRE